MKNFCVIGVNYNDLDLSCREDFFRTNPKEMFHEMKRSGLINGFVEVATCLRIEFYIHLCDGVSMESIVDKMHTYKDKIHIKSGRRAVEYLFNVICGLDSIIVGEDQVLSQIKKSYLSSLAHDDTCPEINVIFNNAVALGKKFRTKSCVTSKPLSLERIAINFIKNHFPGYIDRRFFIIGTGELSRLLLDALKKDGVEDITVTNRSIHNRNEIKTECDVKTVEFDRKYEAINDADIIISATSAPHYIIYHDELIKNITPNKERLFLDIAVPRDIEKNISGINGVNLYNMDNLWNTYESNAEERQQLSNSCSYMIEDQLQECIRWFEEREKAVYR